MGSPGCSGPKAAKDRKDRACKMNRMAEINKRQNSITDQVRG